MGVPKIFKAKQRNPEEILIRQFYITLKNTYQEAALSSRYNDSRFAQIRGEIEEHLSSFEKNSTCDTYSCWTDFYRIERLMLVLFDNTMLAMELDRRMAAVKTILTKDLARLYEERFKTLQENKGSVEEQHSLLSSMVNDLQWEYQKRERMRQYERNIRINVGIIFYLFLIAWVIIVMLGFSCLGVSEKQSVSMSILVAAFSGTIGACFSIMLTLNGTLKESSLEELKTISNPLYHIRRELIGFGAGIIAYFCIFSGIMGYVFSDDLLPVLDNKMAAKDLSLLIVWCFIAGFFEKFIPGILEKTTKQLEDSDKKKEK